MRNNLCKKIFEREVKVKTVGGAFLKKYAFLLQQTKLALTHSSYNHHNNAYGCNSNLVEKKRHTTYRVFIKYCGVFLEYFKIFRTLFSPGVSVCTHTRQVEHQRRSRTGRVQKNPKFSGKKQYLMNTL